MDDDPEPRKYLLREARDIIAQHECAFHGHDFEVIASGACVPQVVLCGRCGQSWPVGLGNNSH